VGVRKVSTIETIGNVVSRVHQAVRQQDFESALRCISGTMRRAFELSLEREIVCFGSAELDNLCAHVGREMGLRTLGDSRFGQFTADDHGATDIYIASHLYDSGGHTALIGDYIRASPKRQAFLLVTDIDNGLGEVRDSILDYLGLPSAQVVLCPETTLAKKLIWLQDLICRLAPARVFLFNHPHDSVAIAASAALTGSTVFFVHHVDRAPCLGALLKSAVHVDLTPFCYYCCRGKAKIADNVFIPLVVKDAETRCLNEGRLDGRGLVIAAAGTVHKFRLDYVPNYIDVVAELLRNSTRHHIHIGWLPESFLDRFRSRLREIGASDDRLTYIPHVASVWRSMAELDVDLYIGSFPVRGARTSIEVMGAGTPALWHVSSDATWFHDTHMKYPEAGTWRTTEELLAIVDNIDGSWLRAQSHAARRHYEAHHRPELIAEYLSVMPVSGRTMESKAPNFDRPQLNDFEELRNFDRRDRLAKSREGKL
jgi:hypothetical protein